MLRRLVFVISVLFAGILPTSTAASPIVTIDQSQTVLGNAFGTSSGESIAQGFVPTLTGLDAVELVLFPYFQASLQFSLNIRSGAFDGAIVGTSALTTVPTGGGLIHFDFPSLVPLTPGALYFIEFTVPSPAMLVYGNGNNPYPSGGLLHNGVPTNVNQDAYFVVGLHAAPVPEPASMTLLGVGLAGLAARRWRQRRSR